MTAFQIDTSDVERGILRIANLIDLATGPIREAMKEVADEIRVDTIATISRQSPPRSQRLHPPGRVTGALIASLKSKAAKPRRGGDLRAYVTSSNLPGRYAFILESVVRFGPRPFLVPAARRHTEDFVARVQAALDLAIRQSTS